ncbi:MAG: type II toxin-antitoxin system RelE family toxin [Pseudomonas sp.]
MLLDTSTVWGVIYHPQVRDDLDQLGAAAANRILDVIEERVVNGEPDKSGKPPRACLTGCQRIRTGDIRIVYRVDGKAIQVLIVAVGARRDKEVYDAAECRDSMKAEPFFVPRPWQKTPHFRSSRLAGDAISRTSNVGKPDCYDVIFRGIVTLHVPPHEILVFCPDSFQAPPSTLSYTHPRVADRTAYVALVHTNQNPHGNLPFMPLPRAAKTAPGTTRCPSRVPWPTA